MEIRLSGDLLGGFPPEIEGLIEDDLLLEESKRSRGDAMDEPEVVNKSQELSIKYKQDLKKKLFNPNRKRNGDL